MLPWLHQELSGLPFHSAFDAFSGTGCVSYLLKCMGKRVASNDFLVFGSVLAKALVVNGVERLDAERIGEIIAPGTSPETFIADTFSGIFFRPEDLQFLDRVWPRVAALPPGARELALAALGRAALKRQPRGVFSIAGADRYDDGRRDLRISLERHFVEGAELLNGLVFDDRLAHVAHRGDVFDVDFAIDGAPADLVYLDPPYVPRSDDNCYVKRYHFVEGLMSYWRDDDARIMPTSRVKKIEKRHSDFSYRRTALDAFARLFAKARDSIIVLSYSSNGWPDLEVLVELMGVEKPDVRVAKRDHRYSFGTHERATRNRIEEYLVIGR